MMIVLRVRGKIIRSVLCNAHIWTDLTVVCWLDLAFPWFYCMLQFICVRFRLLGLFCVIVYLCVCVCFYCVRFRPYSMCWIWIQIHSESGFGFTGKSNGLLDSWVLSEVMSLLFICDTDVTSVFASEFTSKLDSLDSRIRIWIRALNGRIHWIWKIWIRIRQIEYGLSVFSTMPRDLLGRTSRKWPFCAKWDVKP